MTKVVDRNHKQYHDIRLFPPAWEQQYHMAKAGMTREYKK